MGDTKQKNENKDKVPEQEAEEVQNKDSSFEDKQRVPSEDPGINKESESQGVHDECIEKIEHLEQKICNLDNQLKRAVADYINLQRRVEDEKREVIRFANRELLLALLPAFHSLFLAGKHTQDQGVQLTIKSVLEVLKSAGVERVKTEKQKFNAEFMEAVEVVDGQDGVVVEEVRPGFTLYGKLLTPAVVKVGGKKENLKVKHNL